MTADKVEMLVDQVRQFLDYNPDTGILTWREVPPRSRAKLGEPAERLKTTGYLRLHLCGKEVYAHRAAWMHYYGEMPDKMVDHIDGDKTNNRISNLRLADLAQNNWNWKGKKSASGASQYPRTKLWTSKINHRGRVIYIGSFKTKEEAQQAYQAKARELRGEWHEQ